MIELIKLAILDVVEGEADLVVTLKLIRRSLVPFSPRNRAIL